MLIVLDGEELAPGVQGPASDLESLRARLSSEGRVPARLTLDGQDVGLERLGALGGLEAARMEIETLGLGEAAIQAYASAGDFLPKVIRGLERSSDALSLGHISEAMNDLSSVCQGVSWFFDLMGNLSALIRRAGAEDAWDREASEFQELLVRTEKAIQAEDWVLLGDHLRYEWAPRLHAWNGRLPKAQAEASARLLPSS